jgi:hypothetical protein
MSAPLTVYCSQPASGQMATFLQAVGQAQGYAIRLLSDLPGPDALRLQQKRVEQRELLDAIEAAETSLALYASGQLQPDAGAEQGLRFQLESLSTRLKGVQTVLSCAEKGGEDNG